MRVCRNARKLEDQNSACKSEIGLEIRYVFRAAAITPLSRLASSSYRLCWVWGCVLIDIICARDCGCMLFRLNTVSTGGAKVDYVLPWFRSGVGF